jgi:hypothetical protein
MDHFRSGFGVAKRKWLLNDLKNGKNVWVFNGKKQDGGQKSWPFEI